MTVTVYRSDDVGAPTLTVEEGDLITLLDAVLVNGYDVKPAAGWTKPFSGTNQAVYRNSTANGGMGCFFQVDDSKALSGSPYKRSAKIRGASNCTGFDALTEEFGGASYNFLGKGFSQDAQVALVKPWIIVADEHTVLLLTSKDYDKNTTAIVGADFFTPFYFGDYSGWVTAQPSTSCIGGGASTSNSNSAITDNYYLPVHKKTDGTYPTTDRPKRFFGSHAALAIPYNYRYKVKQKGKHVVQGIQMEAQEGADWTQGSLRGINYVRTEDTSDLQTGDTFTEGGKTFLLARILDTTFDVFCAIETSDTWEAV